MAVSYGVIEGGRVVPQYWRGKMTREDVVADEHQHLRDPRIYGGASVLVDAREPLFGITQEEVRDIMGGLYAAHSPPLNIKTCALLVNTLTHPLVQGYEKSVEKYGVSVIAFNFLDEACVWLGLDATMVTSHLEKIRKAQAAPPSDI